MRIKQAALTGSGTILAAVAVLFTADAGAQNQVYTYPNAGQSQEQQSRDRFECHQWAVTQTGFDPTTAAPVQRQAAAPPPPPPDPRSSYSDRRRSRGFLGIGDGGFFEGSGVVGDAATGAAIGAAGGAIAGNAGEGAMYGALASTAFGLLSNATKAPEPRRYEPAQPQQPASDQAYMNRLDQVDEYNRAFGACMTSRDYTAN